MGILRTDVVSHSQLEGSGSVELDGVGDYLTFASNNAFTAGTSDVTFELWVYLTDSTNLSDGNYYLFDMGSNGYRLQIYNGTLYFGDGSNTVSGSGITKNAWHHVAGIRDSGAKKLYLDGNLIKENACSVNHSTSTLTIGSYSTGGGDYEPYGYISNFRYVRGVVYKSNFTPPKFELKNIPGTIVLGCQSTTSATDFAVTPSTVTANGDAAASAFHPGLKKDITDTGVVFDGVTIFDSQAFMVPPSGKTTERNRGRGLHAGGENPTHCNIIDFIQIQSGGRALDFGDLLTVSNSVDGVSSSTRAVFATYDAPTYNSLEFVTMATTGNATDFGDQTISTGQEGSLSNQTRGLFAGGYGGAAQVFRDVVEFITIATLGNAQDFGNLREAIVGVGGASDTTRGLFAGGVVPGNYRANIDQFTIATTGDATDFGDLSVARRNPAGTSDSTRGVFFGGNDSGGTNVIDFVTIQSAGNATDFGDSTSNQTNASGASDSIRGVFSAGYYGSPHLSNVIEKVIIQTTGNSVDYGDLIDERIQGGSVSDSHGGLS